MTDARTPEPAREVCWLIERADHPTLWWCGDTGQVLPLRDTEEWIAAVNPSHVVRTTGTGGYHGMARWSSDANDAVRFATREAAEAAIRLRGGNKSVGSSVDHFNGFVSEHVFLGADAPAGTTRSNIPGVVAKHAIVTPTCRENRTPLGAAREAAERLIAEYLESIEGNHPLTKFHFVLTVERPTFADFAEMESRHDVSVGLPPGAVLVDRPAGEDRTRELTDGTSERVSLASSDAPAGTTRPARMTLKQAVPMPSSTKSCPFCNGVANLFRADLYDDGSKVVYSHECCSCNATAGDFASEAEAEAAWNRRALAGSERTESAPDARLAEVVRICDEFLEQGPSFAISEIRRAALSGERPADGSASHREADAQNLEASRLLATMEFEGWKVCQTLNRWSVETPDADSTVLGDSRDLRTALLQAEEEALASDSGNDAENRRRFIAAHGVSGERPTREDARTAMLYADALTVYAKDVLPRLSSAECLNVAALLRRLASIGTSRAPDLTVGQIDQAAEIAYTDFMDEKAEWSDYKPRSVGRMREVLKDFRKWAQGRTEAGTSRAPLTNEMTPVAAKRYGRFWDAASGVEKLANAVLVLCAEGQSPDALMAELRASPVIEERGVSEPDARWGEIAASDIAGNLRELQRLAGWYPFTDEQLDALASRSQPAPREVGEDGINEVYAALQRNGQAFVSKEIIQLVLGAARALRGAE